MNFKQTIVSFICFIFFSFSLIAQQQMQKSSPWVEVKQKDVIKANINGNVGVGTTQPKEKLHLSGGRMRIDSMAGDFNRLVFVDKEGRLKSVPLSVVAKYIYNPGLIEAPASFNSCSAIGPPDKEHFGSETMVTGMPSGSTCVTKWWTNGCNMYLCDDHNLGLGTNTPSEKLHVVGNARITGFLKVGEGTVTINHEDQSGNGNDEIITTSGEFSIGNDGSDYSDILVGIGVKDPTANLHIADVNPILLLEDLNPSPPSGEKGWFKIYAANGAGRLVSKHAMKLFIDSDNDSETAYFSICKDDDFFSGNNTPLFRVNEDRTAIIYGQATIGTATPRSGYKLTVNGKMIAKELKITLDGWSDFVFDENYELMSLNDLKAYIKDNGHLPDVPSEEEIKEEGVEVGDMQKLQMQKIEELTLYILEQQEMIDKLKKEVEELKK